MSVQRSEAEPQGFADGLAATVAREGTAAHPYLAARHAEQGRHATANLADVLHHLCVLHGRHPGAVDLAAERGHRLAGGEWLAEAADAFADERTALVRLIAIAGPIPSTPGQADCEAAVHAQRHALETLAASDRGGCALGTIAALVLDWRAVRRLMDAAADRHGIAIPRSRLPDIAAVTDALKHGLETPASERAARFGAQQLLIQHRGLWDLLDARTAAREAHA